MGDFRHIDGPAYADSAGVSTQAQRERRRCAGFTYIGLLLLVALIGMSLTVVAGVWQTKQTRQKEDELLFVGDQIRRAIWLYHANTPGGAERLPRRLEDLLRDPRYPDVRRYLRKIYRDPMTGRAEWGLVKSGEFIMGVHSLSDAEPLKKAGFRSADLSFEGRRKYSDWIFFAKIGLARGETIRGASGKSAIDLSPRSGSAPLRANR